MPRRPTLAAAAALALVLAACSDANDTLTNPAAGGPATVLESDRVGVGRAIFFDKNLSLRRNQACVSCHDPAFGFTSPVLRVNAHGAVVSGSVAGRFAIRKPASAAYAAQSPIFGYDPVDDAYV